MIQYVWYVSISRWYTNDTAKIDQQEYEHTGKMDELNKWPVKFADQAT